MTDEKKPLVTPDQPPTNQVVTSGTTTEGQQAVEQAVGAAAGEVASLPGDLYEIVNAMWTLSAWRQGWRFVSEKIKERYKTPLTKLSQRVYKAYIDSDGDSKALETLLAPLPKPAGATVPQSNTPSAAAQVTAGTQTLSQNPNLSVNNVVPGSGGNAVPNSQIGAQNFVPDSQADSLLMYEQPLSADDSRWFTSVLCGSSETAEYVRGQPSFGGSLGFSQQPPAIQQNIATRPYTERFREWRQAVDTMIKLHQPFDGAFLAESMGSPDIAAVVRAQPVPVGITGAEPNPANLTLYQVPFSPTPPAPVRSSPAEMFDRMLTTVLEMRMYAPFMNAVTAGMGVGAGDPRVDELLKKMEEQDRKDFERKMEEKIDSLKRTS